MEENDMGADFLSDEIIDEEIKKMPRKFTLHCFGFLLTILIVGVFCQYASMKVTQAKN